MAYVADAVMLAAAAALAAVHLLKAVRNSYSRKWCANARQVLANAQQWLRHPFRRAVPSEVSRDVAAQLAVRQMRMLQQILPGLKFGALLSMVLHVTHIREASLLQYFLVLLVSAVIFVADWCPWLITEKNTQAWFSCFMVFWPVYIIPAWCSYDTMRETWVSNQMVMMFLSLARLPMPMYAFWNVVRTLCVYWAITARGPGLSAGGLPLMRYELISLIGNIMFNSVFVVCMEAEYRRGVEGQAIEEKQEALGTLLDMAYDVVVELDEDLCIANATPVLSSFLLRPSPTALQHIPFEDLLFEEDDRARFRTRLSAALGTISAKEALHLRMRDINNNAIPVEIFHFHRQGLSRRCPRCTLGLREYGERRRDQAAQGEQPATEADQICKLEEVVAVVDAVQRQLPILDCSPAFNGKIMPMIKGSHLAPALVHSSRFVAWLDASANKQYEDEYVEDIESRDEGPPEFFQVEFRPRSKSSRTYMQAFCSAALIKEAFSSDDHGAAGQIKMQLTFSQLVEMPLRIRFDSSGRSSSSSSGSSHSRSPSHYAGQRRGTPMASPQGSFGDHAANALQVLPPEVVGRPVVRVMGAICSRPLSL